MLQLLKTSLEDVGNGKLREMELEDAETEVCRLEQEARRALEENCRYCTNLCTSMCVLLIRLTMFFCFLTLESKVNC